MKSASQLLAVNKPETGDDTWQAMPGPLPGGVAINSVALSRRTFGELFDWELLPKAFMMINQY